jgi:hypothetical protein
MVRTSCIARALLASLLAAAPAVAQLQWIQRHDIRTLGPSTAIAYDSARSRTVFFDGGDLWQRDAGVWVKRFAPTSPTGSTFEATYDSARSRFVLLASDAASLTSALWEWDGSAWIGPVAAPGYAPAAPLAFDAARSRTVLVVGQQVWEWNGATWSQPATPTSPPARSDYAIAYDSARARTVLFGGGACGAMLGDLWEWDGATWTSVAQPPMRPAARAGAGLAYDAPRARLVLFGGTIDCQAAGDVWEWDGAAWTQASAGGGPSPLAKPRFVFDAQRQRAVLAGATAQLDAWEWDGAQWTSFPAPLGPASASTFGLTYDPTRRQTDTFDMFSHVAWRFENGAWTSIALSAIPTPYIGYATVYDPVTQRTILFGGYNSSHVESTETWAWDGATWQRLLPARSPTRRSLCTMACDFARQRVVLFGNGDRILDTWEWDGTTWSGPFGIVHPASFRGHGMAYDPVGGGMLLFGGVANGGFFLGETWRWDGTNWTQLFPAHHPSARALVSMVTDTARQRIVLFGGSDQTRALSDLWEWDGSDWTQLSTPASPAGRQGAEFVFDSDRGVVLMYGGLNEVSRTFDDTWELTPNAAGPLPASGSQSGGERVSVFGIAGATVPDCRVLFGDADATVLEVAGDRIGVRTPAGSGAADVVVSTPVSSTAFPASYAFVDPSLAARYGNVNVARGDRENVLLVNALSGDPVDRTLPLALGAPIVVQMNSPSSRPTAAFALYAWRGVPSASTLGVLPRGAGAMTFRLQRFGGPRPLYVWNNLGHTSLLGVATLPSTASPSIVASRPSGAHAVLDATLQGLVMDDASQVPERISVTNAVILRIH